MTKRSVRLLGNDVDEPVTLQPEVAEGLTNLLHHAEIMLAGGIDPTAWDEDSNQTFGQNAAEGLRKFRKAIAGEDGHSFDVNDEGEAVIRVEEEP